MENQYEQFLSEDNFTLAYMRLKTATRSPYKEFFYDDFKLFEVYFDQYIKQLVHEIKENIFEPRQCVKYFMPKKKNLARPITMLTLLDQIVYQAIANIVADVCHPYMSKYFNKNTFGNVFIPTTADNRIFFYEKWKFQWKKYNSTKRDAFNEGYEFSTDFDIASFYDTIDHRILKQVMEKFGVCSEINELLLKCLSAWTKSNSASFPFQKSCGIPQGPVSSALFAEVYLFQLDNEMRKRTQVRYFRYADDISIMAKNEDDCRKMVVYLDLMSRDMSLIPQAEKIETSRIYDIDKHIQNNTLRFSAIQKEFKRSDDTLKESTHKKVKRQFLSCFSSPEKFNKSVIRFALFKMNKDDEVKNAIQDNIKQLELFYDGIVFYFGKHYPNDSDFNEYVTKYLLGDTALFQYNKALIFKGYESLDFNEAIFRANFKAEKPFWIVQYQLISWLIRCKKEQLAKTSYTGDNYYILRCLNDLKVRGLSSDTDAQKVFIETLIESDDPLVSMQGFSLWNEFFWIEKVNAEGKNGYAQRILRADTQDYFGYAMGKLYHLKVPSTFSQLLCKDTLKYKEAKDDIRLFVSYMDIDPGKSLMNLNLLHNVIFDVIAEDKGYSNAGEFGSNLNQMAVAFPLAYIAFEKVNQMRNQRTDAHYKDKTGNPRPRLLQSEYKKSLDDLNLTEAYTEIFLHYGGAT